MLEALGFMAENNVVHRDLKPENLLLKSQSNDYDVVIADFGLASFIKPDELLTHPCGSPGYIAPEVYHGRGYNKKADIFSAGAILYLMLTGQRVFGRGNIAHFNKQCNIEYPEKSWCKISLEGKDLV